MRRETKVPLLTPVAVCNTFPKLDVRTITQSMSAAGIVPSSASKPRPVKSMVLPIRIADSIVANGGELVAVGVGVTNGVDDGEGVVGVGTGVLVAETDGFLITTASRPATGEKISTTWIVECSSVSQRYTLLTDGLVMRLSSGIITTPAASWALSNMVIIQVSLASLWALVRPVRSMSMKSLPGTPAVPEAPMVKLWVRDVTPFLLH